jgi:hypothetical protein
MIDGRATFLDTHLPSRPLFDIITHYAGPISIFCVICDAEVGMDVHIGEFDVPDLRGTHTQTRVGTHILRCRKCYSFPKNCTLFYQHAGQQHRCENDYQCVTCSETTEPLYNVLRTSPYPPFWKYAPFWKRSRLYAEFIQTLDRNTMQDRARYINNMIFEIKELVKRLPLADEENFPQQQERTDLFLELLTHRETLRNR